MQEKDPFQGSSLPSREASLVVTHRSVSAHRVLREQSPMEADERRCYAGVVPFSLRCVCSRALRFTLCRVPWTFLPSCIYSEPHLSFELYLLCDFVVSASSSLPYGSYYVEPSPDFVSCLSDKSVRSRLATSHQQIPVKVIFEDRIRPDRVDGDIEGYS